MHIEFSTENNMYKSWLNLISILVVIVHPFREETAIVVDPKQQGE